MKIVNCCLIVLAFAMLSRAQFIDRITRPCSAGSVARALVITNPNSSGDVEITTCTGGAVVINGTPVTPGAAPANATYITQIPDAGLSAEQALSALATGIIKNTTTTGVLSIAVAGDFPTLNQNTTGTAAIASTSTIVNDTTTNATMFPLWVTANTGNLPVKVSSTKLTFNPSTGTLGSTNVLATGTGQFARIGLGVAADATAILTGSGIVNLSASSTLAIAAAKTAIQLGGNGVLDSDTSRGAGMTLALRHNTFFDGTNSKYISTDGASAYALSAGGHTFLTAASGTAGNNVTFASSFSIASTGVITLNTANYNTCTGLTTTAAVLTCTVSDARVKQNFAPFNRGLQALARLRPQSYQFRPGTVYYGKGEYHTGLIAQDVQAAIPEAVSDIGNGTLQIDSATMTATLVNAINELRLKVEAQERQIRQLKRRLK